MCRRKCVFRYSRNSRKKYTINTFTKTSPVTNRKGKSNQTINIKTETKLVDHEVQVDTTGLLNNTRNNKLDNKKTNYRWK